MNNTQFHQKIDDAYFVMELLDKINNSARYDFWKGYAQNQKRARDWYKLHVDRTLKPTFFKIIGGTLTGGSGIAPFRTIINEINNMWQTWIAYVSDILDPTAYHHIEMSVAVCFHPKCPVYTNMGIERGYEYMYHADLGDKKIHPVISVKLHSLTAKVLLNLPNVLLYMVTCPDGHMSKIFSSSMKENIYESDTYQYILKNSKNLKNIKNLNLDKNALDTYEELIYDIDRRAQRIDVLEDDNDDATIQKIKLEQLEAKEELSILRNKFSESISLPVGIRIRKQMLPYYDHRGRRTVAKSWSIFDDNGDKIITINNLDKTILLPSDNKNYWLDFEWLTQGWGIPWFDDSDSYPLTLIKVLPLSKIINV